MKKIIEFSQSRLPFSIEEMQAYNYLKSNGLQIFPHPFTRKYKHMSFSVQFEDGFPYIISKGKKLFFKQNWSEERVNSYYRDLIMEQDPESPHLYCDKSFFPSENDILIDIGVAEGSFTFENLENSSKCFVFEKNQDWILALTKTFQPFKDKVFITDKIVSNHSSEATIKLDDYEEFYSNSLFIKIDVDGSEKVVLEGMKNIIMNNEKIRIVICTYHNQNDYDEFVDFFKSFGFNHSTNPGFMVFYHDKKQQKPYLRKGVLRVWR